jgi:hypothetical protein
MCLERFDGKKLGSREAEAASALAGLADDPVRVAEGEDGLHDIAETLGSISSGVPVATDETAGEQAQKADGVQWTCRVCETGNPLEEDFCSSCGTSIFEGFGAKEEGPEIREDADGTVAALLSVIPGVGHLYLSRYGDGAGRFLMFAWWMASFWLLGGAPVSMAPIRIIILIGLVSYICVNAFDAYRAVQEPSASPIVGRTFFLWASLGIVLLLGAGGVLAFLTASTGG